MRKNLANIITATRILGTLGLIFLAPLTLPFYVVYVWCGLSDVTREEADRLENYVLALGIRSLREWEETWVRNYRGMDPEELLPLNDLRAKFVSEVSEFRKDMEGRGHTVLEYCSALYRFILRCGIQEKLAGQEKEFREAGDLAMEKEYGAEVFAVFKEIPDIELCELGERTAGEIPAAGYPCPVFHGGQ